MTASGSWHMTIPTSLPSERPDPAGPLTPAAARRRLLERVPSRLRVRLRLAEAKLERYRWANAGLRERLAELDVEREQLLDAIAVIIDEEARTIGHAHPVIVRVRAQLDAARP